MREPKLCRGESCDKIIRRNGGLCSRCERLHNPPDPEKRRASWRAKNHRRRARTRTAWDEVTAEYEQALRAKARRCPLCKVRLADKPYTPASKELDHIIPRIVGGTHTVGNVRILCRQCNIARPRDGSDYTGPVTLWSEMPWAEQLRPTRMIGHCECGTRKIKSRCPSCNPPRAKRREADGRRAAELRADGWKWTDIARALGFPSGGSCQSAALAHGLPEVRAQWPGRYVRGSRGFAVQVVLTASTPSPSPTPTAGCVDCGDPVVGNTKRCAECWVEISESDAA